MFPNDWKNSNLVPVFKKGDTQILKNYRPISLLPVRGKIIEKLVFNDMFKLFIENDLISPNQSVCMYVCMYVFLYLGSIK